MINSDVFNYVNVLNKAADAAWQRNDILANNIANVDTPGYKRQDIDFQSQFRRALGNSRYETVDAKVAHVSGTELQARVYTDAANFSYRLDGNNVDMDQEQVELVRTAYEYQYMLASINSDLKRLQNAAKTF